MSNLQPKNFEQFFAQLPTDVNEKGQKFESVIKWWLEEHPVWSTHFKTIWHWNDWPGRKTRDLGIDLVAESHEGKLWAIQVKAYDLESQLKKSDIDSFLSASNQKIFSDRLLVTTTKKMGENLRNTLNSQEKPVKVVNWDSLVESQIDWNNFAQRKNIQKTKPKELRRHQQDALDSVFLGFKKSNRGQLVMACGTGKTLTSIRIAEKMNVETTLVLLPSLTLLSQTLKEWLVERKKDFQWIAVCSDETVANDPSDSSKLIDYDFPVTTNPAEITQFLMLPGRKVIFSTYQSSPAVAAGVEKSSKAINLLIADEAHRLAGKSSSEFSTFVRPSSLKVDKKLFMTATPRIFTSRAKKIADEVGIEINSMDDTEIFGTSFFQYSFRQAIADGMLTDYRVVVIGISDLEVQESVEKRELIKAGILETDAESLAMHIALSKAMKKWDMRRVISFHSRVVKATKFASDHVKVNDWLPNRYKQKGNLQTSVISSSVPTGTRRRILNQMKEMREGDSYLITNARCLTEGVDVPTLDGIAFVDPKSSQVDIVQAVGRAIRLGGKNKTHGTIVIPVFVPKGKDAETILSASNYAPVSSVLNALRAHDEVLSENLDAVRRNLGKTGALTGVSDKIYFDLPKNVTSDFANRLKIHVIEKSSDDWEFNFGKLLEYVKQTGHSRVAIRKGRKGEYNSLGGWIIKQRMDFHSGKLPENKSRALQELPGWSWDPLEDGFKQNFRALEESLKEFGSIRNIPRGYVTKDGIRLSQWLMSIRSSQGRKRIPLEKQNLFLELPGWSWDFREDTWWAGYEAAKDWFAKNNSSPTKEVLIRETGYSLQNWIKVSLKQYRTDRFSSTYTPEKKHKLEEIRNWSLLAKGNLNLEYLGEKTSPVRIRNMEQFKIGIEKYRARFGNINFPITQDRKPYEFEDFPLGRWANGYRSAFKDGSIKDWEKDQLNSIPGWIWDELEFKWNEGFEALNTYVAREGTAQVPQTHMEGSYPLGSWVARQRRIKKGAAQGSFTKEQLSKLESLPNWTWDASNSRSLNKRNEKWEIYFKALQKYVKTHKTSKIPSDYVISGLALGRWVSYQKSAKAGKIKGAKINPDEIKRLEDLPGWSW